MSVSQTLVGRGDGEVSADEVVVSGHAGLGGLAVVGCSEAGPPAVVPADPPHRAVAHFVPGDTGFVGEKPVAELGVVSVGIEDRFRHIRLGELRFADRVGEPAVIGLADDLKDPARHRHGNPVDSELADERVHHFPGRFA